MERGVRQHAMRPFDVVEKLPRAFPPREGQGIGPAFFARHLQRGERRAAQVGIETAAAGLADHVERPHHWEGRDRQAARQRFEDHQPERIGQARKDEDIG
jgi:hypothetical protein